MAHQIEYERRISDMVKRHEKIIFSVYFCVAKVRQEDKDGVIRGNAGYCCSPQQDISLRSKMIFSKLKKVMLIIINWCLQ